MILEYHISKEIIKIPRVILPFYLSKMALIIFDLVLFFLFFFWWRGKIAMRPKRSFTLNDVTGDRS